MAKCIVITGCIDCPYRTGYYFARRTNTDRNIADAQLDNVKLNEWEYKKPDYPEWCPLKEIEL